MLQMQCLQIIIGSCIYVLISQRLFEKIWLNITVNAIIIFRRLSIRHLIEVEAGLVDLLHKKKTLIYIIRKVKLSGEYTKEKRQMAKFVPFVNTLRYTSICICKHCIFSIMHIKSSAQKSYCLHGRKINDRIQINRQCQ